MKFMMLIYSNPESWAGLSAEQRERLLKAHEELTKELEEQGMLVSAAGLADPITTRTVVVRDDTLTTTDGPYAEAKEHLAGLLPGGARPHRPGDRLRGTNAGCKVSRPLEVRPVMDSSGLEM